MGLNEKARYFATGDGATGTTSRAQGNIPTRLTDTITQGQAVLCERGPYVSKANASVVITAVRPVVTSRKNYPCPGWLYSAFAQWWAICMELGDEEG